jgi:hypothetical protein
MYNSGVYIIIQNKGASHCRCSYHSLVCCMKKQNVVSATARLCGILQGNVSLCYYYLLFTGAYSPVRTFGHPFLGFLDHTYRHTVGLLWTSDQPVAEASTYTGQHNIYTQQTNIHAPSGIRTRDPSNQAAADLCMICVSK